MYFADFSHNVGTVQIEYLALHGTFWRFMSEVEWVLFQCTAPRKLKEMVHVNRSHCATGIYLHKNCEFIRFVTRVTIHDICLIYTYTLCRKPGKYSCFLPMFYNVCIYSILITDV